MFDKIPTEHLMRLHMSVVADQTRRLDPFYMNLRGQWEREIRLNSELTALISKELKRRVQS